MNTVKEITLANKVEELGFTATFHTLPASYKRPEWVTKYNKRGVIAKLMFNERSLSFPYYYGSLSSEDVKPSVADLVWTMSLESECVIENTFAQWCDEFGYNKDSIHDRGVYSVCKQRAPKYFALVGSMELVEELRELSREY